MDKKQKEIIDEKSELIEMLVWSYTQGYQHAIEVVKQTVPTEEKLKEMFANHMIASKAGKEDEKEG